MEIKILNHSDELHTCEPFSINCLLWGTLEIPSTHGRIGFVREEGFYLSLTCEESSPLRTYTADNSPVYKDSAMEAFFCFWPKGRPSDIYLNFEMNANGALLAMYGTSRTERTVFPSHWIEKCRCRAQVGENGWSLSLWIPLCILEEIYGELTFENGTSLSLNFYKLSEAPDIEHYASYAPIQAPHPNFHLPQYFEQSVLTEASEYTRSH
ncbi:carbohydrate-binding family 9-like protein [Bariatricus massiliensis]|uniref:Carbohydrate-binding family 9-like protein n=1 Tax=Bariatricus massiliensis TaxID=1745713 RepID=A0ABS8DM60_9FIRM|nr:carbohydrate-binding family 9-like protein [Bariatricus massiliensis]MCB7306391.1 carbohydrate-binding family 9-like protein [Bariatricus massiliensis]MCB7376810.1 carbohydrate-binding family 9-like protein [Bariatricus massiliensis]MCB7389471.1 carbohydrate-binding family 9-like protein [Bariatricus massiliensis]MCB7413641.1 carbohydrate-binding family 9-like protein [Bariatricus massiliensis]MCQ5255526.1 carbohydrate-binding family 9-like protein [Bariatricus massiliensis]